MNDEDLLTFHDLDLTEDPGTDWHPRDKEGVRDGDGLLVDLTDDDLAQHFTKPEVGDFPDKPGESLAAEDSETTPDGEV